MGEIVSFPQRPRIEITSVLALETRMHSASGVSVVRHDPPVRTFFLDYIEADGGRLGLWDGTSYDAALAEARYLRASESVEIRDLTAETWGRA